PAACAGTARPSRRAWRRRCRRRSKPRSRPAPRVRARCRATLCGRARAAQHHRMGLPRHGDVALKATIAAQQPLVLEPPHRLADPELAHRYFPESCKTDHTTAINVIARSAATTQSRHGEPRSARDCFAALAMTGEDAADAARRATARN